MTGAGWRVLPLRPSAAGDAMTVDVEDYFHAAALASAFPRASWDGLPSRVEDNTRRALDLFARHGATGTFFTLGSVARAHPRLIRAIADAGHEVASHGDRHLRVGEQTPAEFARDVRAAKAALEDASGKRVAGYRAANFSIDRSCWWAYDALAESGYGYSSSINPIRHDHYGMPDAPRSPFLPTSGDFVEIPVTTLEAFGRRLPASGGGYFRLLPYRGFRWAIRRARAQLGLPANFFFHPWEIDPDQPRGDVTGRSRFRHYVNLAAMEGKLDRALSDFRWTRIDVAFAAYLDGAPAAEAAA